MQTLVAAGAVLPSAPTLCQLAARCTLGRHLQSKMTVICTISNAREQDDRGRTTHTLCTSLHEDIAI